MKNKSFKTNSLLNIFSMCLTFLYLSNASSTIRCDNLFKPALTGQQFLHQLNQKLHTSKPVELVARKNYISNQSDPTQRNKFSKLTKPNDKILNWLKYLELTVSKSVENSPRKERILKYYQNLYITKESDIPHNFRFGRAEFVKNSLIEQKNSLNQWLNYFLSSDSSMYPMWIKYWVFTSVVRLGNFDPLTGQFSSRSKDQLSPFIELNREALAYVIDAILKKNNFESLEAFDDPQFIGLIESNSFSKMYGHQLQRKIKDSAKNYQVVNGKWIQYKRNSDHMPLVNSLRDKNTNWCTAGESTAKSQLADGDFYVYYSFDKNDQPDFPTIPRIAIRMDGNSVAELRGVDSGQAIDAEILKTTIVENKMLEFGFNGEKYITQLENLRKLDKIESKHLKHLPLTAEEERLISVSDDGLMQVFGQGYPRARKIADQIRITADYMSRLNIQPSEIAFGREQYIKEKTKVFIGHFEMNYGEVNLDVLKRVEGGVTVNRWPTDIPLEVPQCTFLTLNDVTQLKNLTLAHDLVGLTLSKSEEKVIDGISLDHLKSVKIERMSFGQFDSISRITFPDSIEEIFFSGTRNIVDLKLPSKLTRFYADSRTVHASGLKFGSKIKEINLDGIMDLNDLNFPGSVKNLYLKNLTSIHVDMEWPKQLQHLSIEKMSSPKNLKLPIKLESISINHKYFSGKKVVNSIINLSHIEDYNWKSYWTWKTLMFRSKYF